MLMSLSRICLLRALLRMLSRYLCEAAAPAVERNGELQSRVGEVTINEHV